MHCKRATTKGTNKAESSNLETRQQIAALQSSVEPNAVNGEISLHLKTPQLSVVAPVNQGFKKSGNLVKFRKAILEAHSNACFSCKKLHYGRLV